MHIMLLCCLLLLPSHVVAQDTEDPTAKLRVDLVTEKDGKLILERYRVCQVFRPETLGGGVSQPFRVNARMEAPAKGLINRDQFVALATEIGITIRVSLVEQFLQGMSPVQALDALRCRDLGKAVTRPDFEFFIAMSKTGLVVEIGEGVSGRRSKQTYPWSEIFDL